MDTIDRIKLLIEKGYKANAETGEIFGIAGKICSNKTKEGYTILSVWYNKRNLRVLGHQFIYYYFNKTLPKIIDHKNRNTFDNRLENLEASNKSKNSINTIFCENAKGCYKMGNRWVAYISIDSKSKYLGMFRTYEEGRDAYLEAKKIRNDADNTII